MAIQRFLRYGRTFSAIFETKSDLAKYISKNSFCFSRCDFVCIILLKIERPVEKKLFFGHGSE